MNKELFNQVFEQILRDPEKWDQGVWHSYCGTAHCFAGWTQILIGNEPAAYTAYEDARTALGLTELEADCLFAANRTLHDFLRISNNGFYDACGYDLDGFDADGYNDEGFDRKGYNRTGYDEDGFDRDGYNSKGFDEYGYDKDGYNEDGFDEEGYDSEGFDRDGIHRDSKGQS